MLGVVFIETARWPVQSEVERKGAGVSRESCSAQKSLHRDDGVRRLGDKVAGGALSIKSQSSPNVLYQNLVLRSQRNVST